MKNTISMDDLELIVAAANVSGYLESAEKIEIESDLELWDAILAILKGYHNLAEDNYQNFYEFAETELLKNLASFYRKNKKRGEQQHGHKRCDGRNQHRKFIQHGDRHGLLYV